MAEPQIYRNLHNCMSFTIHIGTGISEDKVSFLIKVPNNMEIGQLEKYLLPILREYLDLNEYDKLTNVLLTRDKEGRFYPGNSDTCVSELNDKMNLYLSYCIINKNWVPLFPVKNNEEICTICKVKAKSMDIIRNGWSYDKICYNCRHKLPIEVSEQKLDLNSKVNIHCSYCGRGGVILNKRCNNNGYLFGQCKSSHLSVFDRQCDYCTIPIERVDPCEKCDKRYCSEKCKLESNHDEKCKDKK